MEIREFPDKCQQDIVFWLFLMLWIVPKSNKKKTQGDELAYGGVDRLAGAIMASLMITPRFSGLQALHSRKLGV